MLIGTRRALLGAQRTYALLFNGIDAKISHGSPAALDNLHDAELTVEAFIRSAATYTIGATLRCLLGQWGSTGAWSLGLRHIAGSIGVTGIVRCATTSAYAHQGSTAIFDDKWHHVVMYFNDAGDRKPYLAQDGIWETSYGEQRAGVDAVTTDATANITIGSRDIVNAEYLGAIGWYRISNNDRYNHGSDFTPPDRTNPPATDANTLLLVPVNEGAGLTLDNAQGAADRDGTITNAKWITT